VAFGIERTMEQDPIFSFRILADIALKALSPGINDQSTAILCIDRLSEVLARAAARRVESPYRRDEGGLRVIAIGPSFDDLVGLAFADLLEAGGGKPVVMERLLRSLERIGAATRDARRRKMLASEAARIAECAGRTIAAPHRRAEVLDRAASVQKALLARA
jgi:uncharacterized membrane protein